MYPPVVLALLPVPFSQTVAGAVMLQVGVSYTVAVVLQLVVQSLSSVTFTL